MSAQDLAAPPRETAQGRIASAFLIASLLVGLQSYVQRAGLTRPPVDWAVTFKWTLVFLVFLLARFAVFHRECTMLHLRSILIGTHGLRAQVLVLARGAEMTAWVLLARLVGPRWLVLWGAVVAFMDLLVILLSLLCRARTGHTPLHRDIEQRVTRGFLWFLLHKAIVALVIVAQGMVWLLFFGTREGPVARWWHLTRQELDWYGAAGFLCIVFLGVVYLYLRHPDGFFGYDRILRPGDAQEGRPPFPAHGQFSAGGEVGMVLASASATASVVVVVSSFTRIDHASLLNYSMLLCFLMYRAVYFQRDYLLEAYHSTLRIGNIPDSFVRLRQTDLTLNVLTAGLWIIAALSIDPSPLTGVTLPLLVVFDWVRCVSLRSAFADNGGDGARGSLAKMVGHYLYVDAILLLSVVVAAVFYFSPHAKANPLQLLGLSGADAVAFAVSWPVGLLSLWPYCANRKHGLKAVTPEGLM
jgi:hypothetical protein